MNYLNELISKYQKGDERNIYLIEKMLDTKINYIGKKFGEDIQSEMLIQFPKKLKNINVKTIKEYDMEHSKNYIGKIMSNLSLDIYRKEKRVIKNTYLVSDYSLFENNQQLQMNFQSNLEIKDLIDKLSAKEKTVITRRYIYNDSIIDIAKDMGVSRQWVNQINSKALDKLKKYIN